MQSEFESISTYSGWSSKLAELLADARVASESKNDANRFAVACRLTAFIELSSPASPEIVALDDIAAAAARQLSISVANNAIDRIEARTLAIQELSVNLESIVRSTIDAAPDLSSENRLASVLAQAAQSISDLSEAPNVASNQTLRSSLLDLLDEIAHVQQRIRPKPVGG